MTSRILVCGYFGYGNAGDELILRSVVDDLRSIDAEAEITAVGNAAGIERIHGLPGIGPGDAERLITAASEADLMVLGGGGLFHDVGGTHADRMLLVTQGGLGVYTGFAVLGALAGTPVSIHAIGAGPLVEEDARAAVASAVSLATTVTVRDTPSRDLLASLALDAPSITVTADATFGLPASPPTTGREGVVVSVRSWEGNEWMEPLAAAVASIASEHDLPVRVVPMQAHAEPTLDDRTAAARLTEMLPGDTAAEITDVPVTPTAVAEAFAGADLVIGMRLHAVLAAVQAGAPVIGLVYDVKVRNQLAEAGMDAWAVPLDRLDDLPRMASSLLDRVDRVSERLLEVATEMRRRHARSVDELRRAFETPVRRGAAERHAARFLLDRATFHRELGATTYEVERLRGSVADLGTEVARLQDDYHRQIAQYQELAGSRAVRFASGIWKLTGLLRRR